MEITPATFDPLPLDRWPAGVPPVNAMSIDVEDYFQVQALAGRIDRASWDQWPRRVEANTHRLLDLFAERSVRATFFCLGWVAERCRPLIQRIVAEGHELASHGSDHRRADQQSRDEFRDDVRRARAVLEEAGGVAVHGYRAPTFSIAGGNLWAYDILAEEGYRYSSSVYPVRRDLYGLPSAPRFAFRPCPGHPMIEYPMTTLRLGGRNWPCGGGGFFRLLPLAASRAAIARVNQADRLPAIFYLHPWEIDQNQPKVDGLPAKARFRHYVNLSATFGRLDTLTRSFRWDRIDQVFPSFPSPC